MARNRCELESKTPVEWEIDDEHRMLGCLDGYVSNLSMIQGTLDPHLARAAAHRTGLMEAINEYIQETRKKEFGVDQIQVKLHELQKLTLHNGRSKSIFIKGSQILRKLHIWDFSKVDQYKSETTDSIKARIMGSADRRLRGTPQRASSRATSSHLETRSVSACARTSMTPTRGKKRRDFDVEDGRGDSPSNKSRRQSTSSTPTGPHVYLNGGTIPDSDDHAGEDTILEDPAGLFRPTDPRFDSERELEDTDPQIQSLKNDNALKTKQIKDLQSQVYEEKTMQNLARQKLSMLQDKQKAASLEALTLQRAQSEWNQGMKDRMPSAIHFYEQTIASLEDSLAYTRNTVSFFEVPFPYASLPTEGSIRKRLNELHHEIGKLVKPFPDSLKVCIPKVNSTDRDLASLLDRSLGLCRSERAPPEPSAAGLEVLGLEAIISALTAAALCEWVFEKDGRSSPDDASFLLDKYRYHVSLIGKKNTLRNLDIAAHRSLFDSDDYKEIQIPARAEILAARLSGAIAPFFGQSGDSIKDSKEIDFLEENCPDPWTMLRDRLTDIFKLALGLKADLVATPSRYKMVLFASGTEYIEDCMHLEDREGCLVSMAPQKRVPVQLCILPALFVYREETTDLVDPRIPVSDALEDGEGKTLHLLSKGVCII
ncbi:hypothetical protein FE257_009718 [Aspergillus nanangensis]|uniref:Uncharacterized protein n=1 Tax=Aspergillus nanangensis TaxID=2582783 RepID=A0AAD4CJF6_ASPNN|nr:hypothetical protein FE257_009718 [Aspergillus nanangensis]